MNVAQDKNRLSVLQETLSIVTTLSHPISVFDLLRLVSDSVDKDEDVVWNEFYKVIHLLSKIGFVTNSHFNEKLQETTFGEETTVCPNVSIRQFLEDQHID